MKNKERQESAIRCAEHVLYYFDTFRIDENYLDFLDGIDIGIILGTGWGDVLETEIDCAIRFQLEEMTGFDFLNNLEKIEGHHRELVIGYLKDRKVAMLCGRIHMNESHNNEEIAKAVRLQVEMLFHLGVKHLILTNAAGSLRENVRVGDVVAHDGFITLFAPPLPLWGGEFVSPEDVLKEENSTKVFKAARKSGLNVHFGAGAMVRGPFFEGRRYDKRILRQAGATMAMMSILPEAAVAAFYPDVNVYAISFITNNDSEEHSHEENQKRAKASASKLGDLLLNLIELI